MSVKVTLRQKAISKGRQSLYLDYYPAIINPKTGESTRREFLGLYLYENPKNPIDKQYQKETLQRAEQIRRERENHLNKPEIYAAFEKEQIKIQELGEQSFLEYFKTLADKRHGSTRAIWLSIHMYLEKYTKGQLKFSDINERFLENFKEYLLTPHNGKTTTKTLAQNTAVLYFNKVKSTLRQAYRDGLLQIDINDRVKPIKAAETRREYLTIDELNSLVHTECRNDLLKRAALFSALTGLRFSDIQKLTWGEVEYIDGQGYFLNFTQKKTKGVEVLPISEQAFNLLGERKDRNSKVFSELIYSAYENRHLFQWIGAAGITKNITFHNFRHTFATLQLSKGTDIYTVSKMLGHKDLKTTQIYAKVMNKAKREAVDRIKLDL